MKPKISRRRFVSTVATAAAALAVPRVLTAQKSDKQLVIGTGAHRYEVLHNWAQLPDKYSWQTTHNVAMDREACFMSSTRAARTSKITRLFSCSTGRANSCALLAISFKVAATVSKFALKARNNSST